MLKKTLFLIALLILMISLVQADVIKIERIIQDKETITTEELCLGLKVVRVDYYTYKDKNNKDLDSCVVCIYQEKDDLLIIRHKFKSEIQEIWNAIDAVIDSVQWHTW